MWKKHKHLIIIGAVSVLFLTGVLIFGINMAKTQKNNFLSDGYVREVVADENGMRSNKILFSSDGHYRIDSNKKIVFTDVKKNKYEIEPDSFLYYNDGSISSFSDGMAVNIQETSKGYIEFYKLQTGVVMQKNASGWGTMANGHEVSFPEYLWQTSEDALLVASDDMTLTLVSKEEVKLSGALELHWVAEGIVQIVGETECWQVIANGTKITFASGAVLDLGEKTVYDSDHKPLFTLDELVSDMENGGMLIQADSPKSWKAPEFIIHNEDGKNGENGLVGDSGDNGEIGEDGSSGQKGQEGEKGLEGALGDQGAEGKNGALGEAGEKGTVGDSGAGGSDGVGGANATQRPQKNNNDVEKLGDVIITELTHKDARSMNFTLSVVDENGTFLSDGMIHIREKETEKLVWFTEVDLTKGGELSFDVNRVLTPNTEYVLTVTSGYATEVNGNLINGSKVFLQREFSTSNDGVEFSLITADNKNLYLAINKSEGSMASKFGFKIEINGQTILYPEDGVAMNISDYANGKEELILNLQEILLENPDKNTGSVQQISSNIPYAISLYTYDGSDLSVFSPTMDQLDFKGALDGSLSKNPTVLRGVTLKEKPAIGEIFSSYQGGVYTFTCQVLSDPDTSIKKYVFDVYDVETDMVIKTLESTSNVVSWNNGTDLPSGIYEVSCTVTSFDNEKEVFQKAKKSSFVSSAVSSVKVEFAPYSLNATKGGFVDNTPSKNLMLKEDGTSTAVTKTRIMGDMLISMGQGEVRQLDTASNLTIKVTCKSDPTFEKQWFQSISPRIGGSAGTIYAPISVVGLKPGTEYTISVYGTIIREEFSDTNPGESQIYRNFEYLGSVSQTTRDN